MGILYVCLRVLFLTTRQDSHTVTAAIKAGMEAEGRNDGNGL